MDTVYKTFRAEVKGVNIETGEIDMFIPVSTMSVDRDGEIVEPSAFKKTLPKFMKRPVLVASHDYNDLTNQIGEWSRLKIGDTGMDGKPKYYVNEGNAQADWGFKLASKGMAAFSIGFIPTKWEDGDGVKAPRRTYQEVELLEISQVIVPSNREAQQSVRSKSVDPVVKTLIDDIVNAEIVDLTGGPDELVTKPEETMNMIRMPVPAEEGKHSDHKIRTMDVSKDEGIKALYCVDDKKIITYLFDKAKWDMEKARAWMQAHKSAHEFTQEELIDEIDYLTSMVDKVGLNDKAKASLQDLANKYLRTPGSDIPVKDIAVNNTTVVVETTAKETLTNQDILESIKRIGGKGN
jgi:HK97 family phage prohead protease